MSCRLCTIGEMESMFQNGRSGRPERQAYAEHVAARHSLRHRTHGQEPVHARPSPLAPRPSSAYPPFPFNLPLHAPPPPSHSASLTQPPPNSSAPPNSLSRHHAPRPCARAVCESRVGEPCARAVCESRVREPCARAVSESREREPSDPRHNKEQSNGRLTGMVVEDHHLARALAAQGTRHELDDALV